MVIKGVFSMIFRLSIVVLVLALLLGTAPAALAQDERSVEVWPEKGKVGDTIDIVGQGFNKSTADTDKYAAIFFSSQQATTVDDIDQEVTTYEMVGEGIWLDYDGEFDATFIVPARLDDGEDEEEVTVGTYYVYVCHYYLPNVLAPRIRGVAEFTVSVGDVAIDPDSGPVATLVEITGTGFTADTGFTIDYDDSEVDVERGDYETDDQGDFLSHIRIPESTAGVHTIAVNVPDGAVEIEFSVEPDIALEDTSGEASKTVMVRGTGFGRRTEVAIYFDDQGVATATTDVRGSFSVPFTVPDLAAGMYGIAAEDEDDNLSTAKFTVVVPPSQPTPTITPPPPAPTTVSMSPSLGSVGEQVAVSGAGFAAGTSVTVEYDGAEVATAVADTNGFFTATFNVPASKFGVHTVAVSDGTVKEFTFTVESNKPSAPRLTLPGAGETVKMPVSFNWDDVADDSPPVTYDFQIATGNDFSATSIILEKKGLTASEYRATAAESPKLVDREAPYYWRARAIDGASNAGEWAAARQFSVASPGLPEWVIYIIAGASGALLGLIGVWLLLRSKGKKVSAPPE